MPYKRCWLWSGHRYCLEVERECQPLARPYKESLSGEGSADLLLDSYLVLKPT